jgi:outer membrane protein OmpA-like peptidoglycan-associated protein
MKRTRLGGLVLTALFAVTAVLASPHVYAGLGDKIKKKATDKANKEADKALNKDDAKTDEPAATPASTNEPSVTKDAPAGTETNVSAVSTKFDYVPGDKVLFYDDFAQDELGEFPANWKLKSGTLEVAEMEGGRWMRSTSTTSDVSMKLPAMPSLPEYWTLEFDAYCPNPSGNVWTITALAGNQEVWNMVFPYSGTSVGFTTGEINSVTPLEGPEVWGRTHHIMFMARGAAIKVYVDRQRLANVPEINPVPGAPTTISFHMWSNEGPMITNVRFAEGNKPVADPFANGKLVTYGIYFDSGSDVVKAESAPVLRQIAAYMEKNPSVKVEIDGHTDNQGTADGNLDLSKRRSASVAAVLSDQFKIAAERFKTDGMGDTKPVASNDKSEGRAMNRRVEFSKL